LARSDELATEIGDLAVYVDTNRTATGLVTGFKDKDSNSAATQTMRAHEAGHTSADHDNIDIGIVVGHVTSWVGWSCSRRARARQRTHLPPRR
jgi:hypothetical protein